MVRRIIIKCSILFDVTSTFYNNSTDNYLVTYSKTLPVIIIIIIIIIIKQYISHQKQRVHNQEKQGEVSK